MKWLFYLYIGNYEERIRRKALMKAIDNEDYYKGARLCGWQYGSWSKQFSSPKCQWCTIRFIPLSYVKCVFHQA